MKKRDASAILFILLLISTFAFGFDIQDVKGAPRTWTVDDDLQDYPDADFRKIQDAVNSAYPGDTILVYRGVYRENVDVAKSLNIKSASGAEETIVKGVESADFVFNITADHVTVKGFGLIGTEAPGSLKEGGVILESASNCSVLQNHIFDTSVGIVLKYSGENDIANNYISNFGFAGIYLLRYSYTNMITGNLINSSYRHGDGIHLYGYSSNNIIRYNTFVKTGLLVRYSWDNIVEDNTVNGKPLLYLKEVSNCVISGIESVGQLVAVNSFNITINNVDISDTNVGIEFFSTSNSRIANSNVALCREGILLYSSSNNVIAGNALSNNSRDMTISQSRNNIVVSNTFVGSGMYSTGLSVHSYLSAANVNHHIFFNTFILSSLVLDRSSGNYIYLNNFLSSYAYSPLYMTSNIWNTPLETRYTYKGTEHTNYLGNYWSNYTGADANNDGIGDTPYDMVWSDKDDFPLIGAFESYKCQPNIGVDSPNGGESWLVGSFQRIKWKSFLLLTTNVTIELSTVGGSTWEEKPLVTSTFNDGEEYWRVMAYPGNEVRIRVTNLENQAVKDMSDSDFSISTVSTANTFPAGYCTWWAYERRAQLDMPVEWLNKIRQKDYPRHAYKWFSLARRAGIRTGSEPRNGAIAVWGATPTNDFGHVAIVEWIEPGPEETWAGISEMNYGGFVNPDEGITVNFRKVTDRMLVFPRPPEENFLGFIYAQKPVAKFIYDPHIPSVDETITFNASSSYDPDGKIISYQWEFGDNSSAEGVVADHSYSSTGIYTVALAVTDIDGLTDTCNTTVAVVEAGLHECIQIAISLTAKCLDEILREARWTAEDGDYFEEAFGKDKISLVLDVILDAFSAIRTSQVHENIYYNIKKLSTPSVRIVQSYLCALGLDVNYNPVLSEYWLHTSNLVFEEYISTEIEYTLRNLGLGALKYFAADLAAKFEFSMGEEALKKVLLNELTHGTQTLENNLVPSLEKAITAMKSDLLDLITPLGVSSSISPEESQLYQEDLQKRWAANAILTHLLTRNALPLHFAQNLREVEEEGWGDEVAEFLMKYGAKILAGILLDDPGPLIVSLGILLWDYYQNSADIDQDAQMVRSALGTLVNAFDTSTDIYLNIIGGLESIRYGITPHIAKGKIIDIRNIVNGSVKIWGENNILFAREAFSNVSIQNTGTADALFSLSAEYGKTGFLGGSYTPLVARGAQEIKAGEIDSISIYYLQDGRGEKPDDNGNILFHLLGATNTGLYYVDSDNTIFGTEKIVNSQTLPLSQERIDFVETLPYPIRSAVQTSVNSTEYELEIWLENPFNTTISANLTQQIPATITVTDPNNGTVEGDTIIWYANLSSEEAKGFAFTFVCQEPPSTTVEIPGAVLSIYDPVNDSIIDFEADLYSFKVKFPVIVRAYPPTNASVGEDIVVPMNITNLLTAETFNGNITLELFDSEGSKVHSLTEEISLAPRETKAIELVATANVSAGMYLIEGMLHQDLASTNVLGEYISIDAGHLLGVALLEGKSNHGGSTVELGNYTTTTNPDGSYSFTEIGKSNYSLLITHPGYVSVEYNISMGPNLFTILEPLTLTAQTPTEIHFALSPNPAIIGQTITLIGKLTTNDSLPIGGETVIIKVNSAPIGTLTTNSTGWFNAAGPITSEGNYTIRVEYKGSTEHLPSYDEQELIVGTISISVYTDKYSYSSGDSMHLGLDVINRGSANSVCIVIWVELPNSTAYDYTHYHNVTLPAGLEYHNPNFQTITLPSIPAGTYTWHAAIQHPATHKTIVEDTAKWEFT